MTEFYLKPGSRLDEYVIKRRKGWHDVTVGTLSDGLAVGKISTEQLVIDIEGDQYDMARTKAGLKECLREEIALLELELESKKRILTKLEIADGERHE